eukprot:TRINITY_DN45131_c0_g1_i1.p1 TRINITY_DN45131_c0_g1~~TRINITY_DN45131_c0_g1_i1.p1  ORF type:complete len:113 (+),score=22.43 TRINITY_DN45131_c0_g1_i1:122-460(+)
MCIRDSDGNYYDDDDDENEFDDEIDPQDIRFAQDSIAPVFSDGTTYRQAIYNIKCGVRYPVRVYEHPHLGLIAINNRTLYCYKEACVDTVPVIFTNQIRRKAFDTIFIRGGN